MLTFSLSNLRLDRMNRDYPWETFDVHRPYSVVIDAAPHQDMFIFKITMRRGPLLLHVCAATPESAFAQAVAGWLHNNGCEPERAQNAGEQVRRALMN